MFFFFFSSRRRHTRCSRDWSSDVCSSDLFQQPIQVQNESGLARAVGTEQRDGFAGIQLEIDARQRDGDRKSTRLNSSHGYISYAVFCLKKNNNLNLNVTNPPMSMGTCV